MATIKISGQTAWTSAVKSKSARWSDHIGRLSGQIADVTHTPKFTIGSSDRFFCIGSCFARNIEEHLIYHGVTVLSRQIICPKSEWPNRVNGFVNKFTTHSIRNELDWVCNPPAIGPYLFEEQERGWVDPQLCPGVSLVSLERAIERRKYLTEEYFTRVRDASIIVITLGLNEVWFDQLANRHLNAAPSFYATRRNPGRYQLHITDIADNLSELHEIHRLILQINKKARIIITVSPVPMSDTFSGRDVLIANVYSKCTLRAAAEIFTQLHDNVDYFPTFDIISVSPRDIAYGADCLHVSDAVVGEMMQSFMRLYLESTELPAAFNELAYLEINPDVEDAVRRGEFISGFEHWQRHGQSEGRQLYPPNGPTSLMIAAGAV